MARLVSLTLFTATIMSLSGCSGAPGNGETTEKAPADTVSTAPDGAGVVATSNGLRLSANPGAPSAAYLVLTGGSRPMTLTSVTSPAASRIELHESVQAEGMVSMRAVERIEIPANGEVIMRPGGLHLMIFDLSAAARSAQSIPLTLTFADGTQVAIDARAADLAGGTSNAAAQHQDHEGH